MSEREDVAISMVYPILKTLAHRGVEESAFCRYAGFDPELLRDIEARIPGEELERLTNAAAAYTGDEHFGLHQGQLTDFADLGILGYVMLHSRTLGEALVAYRRYNVIVSNSFNLDWETEGERLTLRLFGRWHRANRLSRHCVEDMASSVHRLMERLGNRPIPLHAVRFTHAAPSDLQPYEAVFGVTPEFGAEACELDADRTVLERPVLYADAKLLGVFEAIARQTTAALSRANAVADRVLRQLATSYPNEIPTVGQTAEALGMSMRTLQHKLKAEGCSYQELTVRFRKELAIGLLQSGRHTVGDVAYALHFSEPSAFQNAFKKWTGLTPSQYRRHESV